MQRRFILVECVNDHHSVPIDVIKYVSPYYSEKDKSGSYKSTITVDGCDLYSTETPQQIHEKVLKEIYS